MTRAGAPAADRAREAHPLPPRPGAVELAAAILIVAGVLGVVTAAGRWFTGSTEPFLWLGLALNVGSVILGIATRSGRLWLVTLNYAAILGFLDLLGGAASPAALTIGLSEVIVVVILLLRKPWFDAVAAARAAEGQGAEPPGTRPDRISP